MATYEEYLDHVLGWTSEEQEKYNAKRRQQADDAAAKIQESYKALSDSAAVQYAEEARVAKQSYREAFDANAVNEAVARRNAAEAIANSNAVNSGLNNTQQTAISLVRGRADAQTAQQRENAVNAIMRELDDLRAQYRLQESDKVADVYAQADQDIAASEQTRYDSAREEAYKLYNADGQQSVGTTSDTASGAEGDKSKTLSYSDVKAEAKYKLQTQGVHAATKLLTQYVNREFITGTQRSDIMIELGIREASEVPIGFVEKVMTDILLSDGRQAAEKYVQHLFDNNTIDMEQLYQLTDKMDRIT